MTWRGTQSASRSRYLAKFTTEEVERYEGWILQFTAIDETACLEDISRGLQLHAGMVVLDVGAGTGILSKILTRIPGLAITALEPAPAMLAKLRANPELKRVQVVEGFCDAQDDRTLFPQASFDVIASRQLVNGLFDPLAAFANWHYWLKPGGSVVVIDGLYDRSAWTDQWQEEVDVLPLSALRTTAAIPYLMEVAGFHINTVQYMDKTNSLPASRTQRYMIIASKNA